jgi:ADP-ribose pyrophosphatase YjhB (NUDIX family)
MITNDRPLTDEQFKSIYTTVPRLCVDLVVKSKEGVLLTYRTIKPAGYWHLPGGTFLLGESLTEAVARIVKGELGLTVEIAKMAGVIDYTNEYIGMGHPISIVYEVRAKTGAIKLDDQASEAKFFKKLPEKIFDEQRAFLKEHFGME